MHIAIGVGQVCEVAGQPVKTVLASEVGQGMRRRSSICGPQKAAALAGKLGLAALLPPCRSSSGGGRAPQKLKRTTMQLMLSLLPRQ